MQIEQTKQIRHVLARLATYGHICSRNVTNHMVSKTVELSNIFVACVRLDIYGLMWCVPLSVAPYVWLFPRVSWTMLFRACSYLWLGNTCLIRVWLYDGSLRCTQANRHCCVTFWSRIEGPQPNECHMCVGTKGVHTHVGLWFQRYVYFWCASMVTSKLLCSNLKLI